MSGHSAAQKSIPNPRSDSSAVPNMNWLDITRPARTSAGVRSETTVTS